LALVCIAASCVSLFHHNTTVRYRNHTHGIESWLASEHSSAFRSVIILDYDRAGTSSTLSVAKQFPAVTLYCFHPFMKPRTPLLGSDVELKLATSHKGPP